MAMAARNSGGIVIAQVRQLARARLAAAARRQGARRARRLRLRRCPTSGRRTSPRTRPTTRASCASRSCRSRRCRSTCARSSPAARCSSSRRATSATWASASRQLIGRVAWEEGMTDQLVLTVEQGIFGGAPVAGNEGGAGFNYQAMIDQPYMFRFYDGGGLDVASLSFAEVDAGRQRQRPRLRGPHPRPGRLPEHQRPDAQDQLRRHAHGAGPGARHRPVGRARRAARAACPSSCRTCAQISFNGKLARERGQQVRYITDRAVFELRPEGVTLIELAPGIDLERDVMAQMGFTAARRRRLPDDRPARLRRRADGSRRGLCGRA